MANDEKDKRLPETAGRAEIDAFLRKAALIRSEGPKRRGRLIFAMDATASREPTWDLACQIQGEMFQATESLGGLDVQLCHYSGVGFFHATGWLSRSDALLEWMSRVRCVAGGTQIGRVLEHGYRSSQAVKVNTLVFVGDCVEENPDTLIAAAGKLGIKGVPIFVFHEGFDSSAGATFQQIARVSSGAYCRFDASSPGQLKDLLGAVAAYAAGGRSAMLEFGEARGEVVRRLTNQFGSN